MKLSVIIPVYNEENTVSEILHRVIRLPLETEIIVVDDGSTDGTGKILDSWGGDDLLLLRHEVNRGKGAAIHTALARASGEAIVIQDADLEYDPEDLIDLFRPIQEGREDVVFGSRVLGNPDFYSMGFLQYHRAGFYRNPILTFAFYHGGRTVTHLTNILFGARLTDQPTCYKMFRRELLNDIRLSRSGFEFCSEFTAKILLAGYTICEVPVSYHPRGVAEGKKLKWKDGIQAILTLLRIRFSPGSDPG